MALTTNKGIPRAIGVHYVPLSDWDDWVLCDFSICKEIMHRSTKTTIKKRKDEGLKIDLAC